MCQQRGNLWGDLPLDCFRKLASARWCQGSKSRGDFSGNLRVSWSGRLGYSHSKAEKNNSNGNFKKTVDWFHSLGGEALLSADSVGQNQCMQISHRELVGCDVSKAYLQHERHSRIHYDNDDQCNAPVMGNTHDLSGGRAAGRVLNGTPHIRFLQHHATSQPLLHLFTLLSNVVYFLVLVCVSTVQI